MVYVELQGGLFADCQESRFEVAKRSDMICAILEENRFSDAQELRFQAAIRSDKV